MRELPVERASASGGTRDRASPAGLEQAIVTPQEPAVQFHLVSDKVLLQRTAADRARNPRTRASSRSDGSRDTSGRCRQCDRTRN